MYSHYIILDVFSTKEQHDFDPENSGGVVLVGIDFADMTMAPVMAAKDISTLTKEAEQAGITLVDSPDAHRGA